MIVWASVGVTSAQTIPVIHWINGSNHAIAITNPGDTFTTNFRGTNDVTVTLLSGNTTGPFIDVYGGATPGNNPSYLTNFVGQASNGTGDGTLGDLNHLGTTGGSSGALQFDFTQPVTSADRLIFNDIDFNESYMIQAFQKIGTNFVQVSTAGWTNLDYSGHTGITPNSLWPIWNGANGTLTSNTSSGLNSDVNVLIPDASLDRLVVTKTSGAGASTDFQVAEPSGTARGDMNFDGHVTAKDVAAIMQALANETGYATANGVSQLELETVGDVNFDGKFTNADLQKLLNNLKTGGGSAEPVPEPSTLALLTLGGVIALTVKRRRV